MPCYLAHYKLSPRSTSGVVEPETVVGSTPAAPTLPACRGRWEVPRWKMRTRRTFRTGVNIGAATRLS